MSRTRNSLSAPAAVLAAGAMAGVVVGLIDGARVALAGRLGAVGFVACVLLIAALYTAIAGAVGPAVAGLLSAARWGRQAALPPVARALGWLVTGCGCVAAVAVAVAGTASRNNRFLAAGIVALALVLAASVGALVAPACARLLAGKRATPGDTARPVRPAGLLVLAPLAAVLAAGLVFLLVWRLDRSARILAIALAALPSALLPWALARASVSGGKLGWARAAGVAALSFGVPGAALLWARWASDLQFVRWADVTAAAAMIAVALAIALRGPRLGPRARIVVAVGLPLVAVVVALAAASDEAARKTAAARAGFVGPALAIARGALDRDRDGYPWLLGGGDCDDGDPAVNPAAQDWPDDGLDQDCDGQDATVAQLASPPYHPVPDAVPRDLNILFITIDTLRADRLGAYGYARPTSPALDALAADGVLFENGWAHAPSTRYSMPALATGRWPSAISWDESIFWPRIAPEQRTIGQALKQLGYVTGAFFAYHYFDRAYARGFERGIDHYDTRRAALHADTGGPAESVGSSGREMADDGIAFLQAQQASKFFLWLHFYDPHLSYQPRPDARFGSSQSDLYDGEIRFTDQQVGRVLAEVKRLGLWDRTAVFVTGDHGEGLGEKGINAHGYHLYAPQTKVPFIFRVPGVAPRRVRAPVGHVDVAPTLVNLARGEHEKAFLGRSMVDLMTGGPTTGEPPPPVFQEVTYEDAAGRMDGTRRRALVTESHHLIWNWTPDNTTECYDLRADPGQTRDLWLSAAGEPHCSALKADLRRKVALLSLPAGYAEKISFGLGTPADPLPAPAHRADVRFGDLVRLVGYDLSAASVARGGQIEIAYHFEALRAIDAGWRLFVHVQGPQTFINADHVPVEGAFPLERWRPGQRIRDRQRIAIPPHSPPGTYTIHLGFWKGSERLPVAPAASSDGQGRLRLVELTVH